jgi:hypothetical protein
MDNLRFFGLAAFLFAAVFFGMKWLLRIEPGHADARLPTFHQVDPDSPSRQLMSSSISDDDPTRDRLRHAVLDEAKLLDHDPCSRMLKAHYIEAVNAYARAWISIVPCLGTRTCGSSDSAKLDRAAHAFGSPLDLRLREAMQRVHRKTVFKLGDFPNDDAPLVAELATDGAINPLVVHAVSSGPVNAGNDQRPHPSFDEIRTQLGDSDSSQDCTAQ